MHEHHKLFIGVQFEQSLLIKEVGSGLSLWKK